MSQMCFDWCHCACSSPRLYLPILRNGRTKQHEFVRLRRTTVNKALMLGAIHTVNPNLCVAVKGTEIVSRYMIEIFTFFEWSLPRIWSQFCFELASQFLKLLPTFHGKATHGNCMVLIGSRQSTNGDITIPNRLCRNENENEAGK